MVGLVYVENKINLNFFNKVEPWRRVLSTGPAKIHIKELTKS